MLIISIEPKVVRKDAKHAEMIRVTFPVEKKGSTSGLFFRKYRVGKKQC